MSESIESRLAHARAALAETEAAVAQAQAAMHDASATVRSRDRSVEVTVGPQGEVTEIRFLDGKYRTMGATQLSAALMEAIGTGRSQMARRVMDAFGPLAESISDLRGPDRPGLSWDEMFGPLAATAAADEKTKPSGNRPSRLRDEIHEDERLS